MIRIPLRFRLARFLRRLPLVGPWLLRKDHKRHEEWLRTLDVGEYVRHKMREESFRRKIMPPNQLGDLEGYRDRQLL